MQHSGKFTSPARRNIGKRHRRLLACCCCCCLAVLVVVAAAVLVPTIISAPPGSAFDAAVHDERAPRAAGESSSLGGAAARNVWDRVTSLSSHLFEWTSTLGGPPSLRAWSMQLQTESSPPAPTAAATIIDTTADEQ